MLTRTYLDGKSKQTSLKGKELNKLSIRGNRAGSYNEEFQQSSIVDMAFMKNKNKNDDYIYPDSGA